MSTAAVNPGFDTVLNSPRLLMRPAMLDDVVAHFDAARDSMQEVGRWLSWCTPEMTLEDSEAWIATCRDAWATGEFFSFFLFEREGGNAAKDGRFVGCCTINDIDRFRLRANLGYWIRGDRQGRGLASEAAPVVARFGFERLGLMRLEIVAAAGNVVSQRVAGKIGAKREGLARNRLRIHDVQHDAVVFSIIPSDFDKA